MSILYNYVNREIFKHFGVIVVVVVSIYVAVDFFEKIDDFMEAGLPFSRVLSFFLYNIPFVVAQIVPVGLFLSILIVFCIMSKSNEIIALRSSGISIYYLLLPLLSVGVLFTILIFFLSEVVVPFTTSKANKIWLSEVRKERLYTTREKNVWIKGNRKIIHIKYYDATNRSLHGISINYFDKDFNLIRRVDAKEALFEKEKWVLTNSMVQTLNTDTRSYKVTFNDKEVEPLDFSPEDMKRAMKKSVEMSFKELLSYIRKVEAEGYDATVYRVDLQAKIAFPFVCIILCMLGIGISVRGKLSEGIPLVVGFGLGIVFFYWIFNSFCLSLGYGEVLPAWVAVWVANFTFLCFGLYTLMNAV